MKNLQKLFSVAMLVCLAVAMFSCSKDDEEVDVTVYSESDLVGEWTILSNEIETIGSDQDVSVSPYLENSVLEFMGDMKYSIRTESSNVAYESGSWKLEDGMIAVLINDITKFDKKYEIKSLDEEGATLYHKQTVEAAGAEAGFSETIILKSLK